MSLSKGNGRSFSLDTDQSTQVAKWKANHECSIRRAYTAIGGGTSYEFTPTGLGEVVIVKCGCGDELDLTCYDMW